MSGENISDADYQHALSVWRAFECKTMQDYTLLYMKLDVLILADVFEEFRTKSLASYQLDPAHYFTTPGLSFDAMLKYTGVKLELLTDIDMVLFIEKGIRGGKFDRKIHIFMIYIFLMIFPAISHCCNRYSKANNKYMGQDFNPSEESKYI